MRFCRRFPIQIVCFLTFGVGLVLGLDGCGKPHSSSVQNVVLIVIDTLRADILGCYGGPAQTPNIDQLAAGGVRFSQARSHIPITGPSHSSLFTSLWPQEHGFTNNAMQLSEARVTMAELLQKKAMHTAGFVSLGVLKGKFGFKRGFEVFSDRFGIDWFRSAGEMNQDVQSYLETRPDGPHFLWVHYSDPHEPYQDPDSSCPDIRVIVGGRMIAEPPADGRHHLLDFPLRNGEARLRFQAGRRGLEDGNLFTIENAKLNTDGKIRAGKAMFPWFADQTRNDFVSALPGELVVSVRDRAQSTVEMNLVMSQKRPPAGARLAYIREVEYADRQLGHLLESLRQSGLLAHSLVVVTADHGEGLGDHDLPGHIEQLYDSLLHVPLIFWAPGSISQGVVDDRPVGLVDVLPTVAGMTGLQVNPRWRGVDLLADHRTRESLPLIAATYQPEAKHNLEAIVDGHFKLIRNLDDATIELYDLKNDPKELKDLAQLKPEKVAALQAKLHELLEGVETPPKRERVLDEETRDQLRALGYAD